MFSNTGEERPQPNPALAEKPLPAPLRCHVAPVGISILLYLGSFALIAAGTLGVSLGTGFYLLVHPAQEMAAGYAKRDRGSGITPREDSIAGASPLDDQTAPILGEAEIPRSAVTVPSPAAGPRRVRQYDTVEECFRPSLPVCAEVRDQVFATGR